MANCATGYSCGWPVFPTDRRTAHHCQAALATGAGTACPNIRPGQLIQPRYCNDIRNPSNSVHLMLSQPVACTLPAKHPLIPCSELATVTGSSNAIVVTVFCISTLAASSPCLCSAGSSQLTPTACCYTASFNPATDSPQLGSSQVQPLQLWQLCKMFAELCA
jgi:hypothetical protein